MDKSIMQSLSYRLSHDFCSAHWTRFFSPTSFFLLSDHLNKKWNGLVVVLCAPQTHWLKYFLISILAYMAASGSQFSCPLGMGSIRNDKWHLFSPLNSFFFSYFFLSTLLFLIIWTKNEMVWWLFYVLHKHIGLHTCANLISMAVTRAMSSSSKSHVFLMCWIWKMV